MRLTMRETPMFYYISQLYGFDIVTRQQQPVCNIQIQEHYIILSTNRASHLIYETPKRVSRNPSGTKPEV